MGVGSGGFMQARDMMVEMSASLRNVRHGHDPSTEIVLMLGIYVIFAMGGKLPMALGLAVVCAWLLAHIFQDHRFSVRPWGLFGTITLLVFVSVFALVYTLMLYLLAPLTESILDDAHPIAALAAILPALIAYVLMRHLHRGSLEAGWTAWTDQEFEIETKAKPNRAHRHLELTLVAIVAASSLALVVAFGVAPLIQGAVFIGHVSLLLLIPLVLIFGPVALAILAAWTLHSLGGSAWIHRVPEHAQRSLGRAFGVLLASIGAGGIGTGGFLVMADLSWASSKRPIESIEKLIPLTNDEALVLRSRGDPDHAHQIQLVDHRGRTRWLRPINRRGKSAVLVLDHGDVITVRTWDGYSSGTFGHRRRRGSKTWTPSTRTGGGAGGARLAINLSSGQRLAIDAIPRGGGTNILATDVRSGRYIWETQVRTHTNGPLLYRGEKLIIPVRDTNQYLILDPETGKTEEHIRRASLECVLGESVIISRDVGGLLASSLLDPAQMERLPALERLAASSSSRQAAKRSPSGPSLLPHTQPQPADSSLPLFGSSTQSPTRSDSQDDAEAALDASSSTLIDVHLCGMRSGSFVMLVTAQEEPRDEGAHDSPSPSQRLLLVGLDPDSLTKRWLLDLGPAMVDERALDDERLQLDVEHSGSLPRFLPITLHLGVLAVEDDEMAPRAHEPDELVLIDLDAPAVVLRHPIGAANRVILGPHFHHVMDIKRSELFSIDALEGRIAARVRLEEQTMSGLSFSSGPVWSTNGTAWTALDAETLQPPKGLLAPWITRLIP